MKYIISNASQSTDLTWISVYEGRQKTTCRVNELHIQIAHTANLESMEMITCDIKTSENSSVVIQTNSSILVGK
jgi:hypothetical protein